MSALELQRTRDGRWRWAYREKPGARALPSNEDYEDLGEARAAAEAAYPNVPVETAGGAAPGRPAVAEGRLARWLALAIVLLAWARRGRR